MRRFCARHSYRGDCGINDADANYELLEGPGIQETRETDRSQSAAIFLNAGVLHQFSGGGEGEQTGNQEVVLDASLVDFVRNITEHMTCVQMPSEDTTPPK